MKILAELYSKGFYDEAIAMIEVSGISIPFSIKNLLKKIKDASNAEEILLKGVQKLGKDKVMELFEAVDEEYGDKTTASFARILTKFAYPLLLAAAFFLVSLGTKQAGEFKEKLENMQEQRIEQIMDVE